MASVYQDLVVVGAGWHGLAAAKTFLQVHPTAKLLVLDAAPSIGGVWASHRLYNGLKSNNQLGTYEYSDFPMDTETYGVKTDEHIPGEVLHRYLEDFADHFNLANKIRLNAKVTTAEHQEDGSWSLSVVQQHEQCASGEASTTIYTRKLIVATGLASEPFIPDFPGQEDFDAPLFHSRDMVRNEAELLKPNRRAVIIGGTKSAWDAAYSCASSGVGVDMVIRESGHGPVWMSPVRVTPLKLNAEDLITSRFFTWFTPCVWDDISGYKLPRRFLHGTWLGRSIIDIFWGAMENDICRINDYESHPDTRKLKPWVSPFWTGGALSALNYENDFFQYVREGKIRVHVADISSLSSRTVHLSNGESLQTDALVCATGWKATPPIKFLPEGIHDRLGLPWGSDLFEIDQLKEIDEEIIKRFPRLKSQPTINTKLTPMGDDSAAAAPHPYRLTRFMVPHPLRHEHSIAFLGMIQSFKTALIAQTQALWATAYLDGKVPITAKTSPPAPTADVEKTGTFASDALSSSSSSPEEQEVAFETALHTQFGKWRCPGGYGKQNPDFSFDTLPYIDMLLDDLGLQYRRKNGLLAELFQAYAPPDYRGLVDEWKQKQNIE